MRRFALDVTKAAQPGKKNALALRIQGQGQKGFGTHLGGLGADAARQNAGPVARCLCHRQRRLRMHDPFVRSRVATNLDSADLIVSMDLENASDKTVAGVVAVILDGAVTKSRRAWPAAPP